MGDANITETVRAGVTTRTTEIFGGATTQERYWTDPASGAARSMETRTDSAWGAEGLETVTASSRSDGGAWTAESVTRKDFLGRTVTASRPGFGGSTLTTSNAYDSAGRTILTAGEDGTKTVYAYTALGKPAGSVKIGAGQTLQFEPSGFTLAAVIALGAYVVTATPMWKEEGDLGLSAYGVPNVWWDCSAAVSYAPGRNAVTTSVTRTQLTGLSAACVKRVVTSGADNASTITTEATDSGQARTTVTTVNTATLSSSVEVAVAGTRICATNSLGSSTAYTFDGLGRQVAATETAGGRTLTMLTGYHADGVVAFNAEASGLVSNVTSYSERQYLPETDGAYTVTTTDALGNETVNYYTGDGVLYRSGGAVYPAATAMDARGRQAELRTWRDGSGEPDITRWLYDDATGLLTNKIYADGLGPAYTYTADGRPASRTWARGVGATYAYADTAAGSVRTVSYSDATPAVINVYDLAGRLVAVDDGSGARTLSHDARDRLTAETNALAVITRRYDSLGRDAGYDLDLPCFTTDIFSVRYGYDEHSRLASVQSASSADTNHFAYSYLPGTSLVSGMTNACGGGWTRTYEPNRNLIAAVSNFWGATAASSFQYANDALGRRTSRLDTCGTGVPPVVATNDFCYNARSEVTNAVMSETTYSYSYDDIGNRKWATADESLSTYAANELNQYMSVTNAGVGVPVVYDADGNMLTNGVWAYTWDAENRMTSAISNGVFIVSNAYDALNRRILKTAGSVTRHYVWDGWNIAAEIVIDLSAQVTNIHFYTWGLDLSGTIQGAGGVGGLLADTTCNNQSVTCNTYYPAYDANGIVTEYVDAQGTVRGRYEYSAFGETTAQIGDLAGTFTHRFSTKPFDAETGISKYQRRDYLPELGRWASRDPIGENGGLGLYASANNDMLSYIDLLGMSFVSYLSLQRNSVLEAINTHSLFAFREVNSVSDIEIVLGSVASQYGGFDPQLSVEVGDCEAKVYLQIRLSPCLIDTPSKGVVYSYTPHVRFNNALSGGSSNPPLYGAVKAHEEGHAWAFLLHTKPCFDRATRRFEGKRLTKTDVDEVKSVFSQCRMESLDQNIDITNRAELEWYRVNGFETTQKGNIYEARLK